MLLLGGSNILTEVDLNRNAQVDLGEFLQVRRCYCLVDLVFVCCMRSLSALMITLSIVHMSVHLSYHATVNCVLLNSDHEV